MPSEVPDHEADEIREKAQEFGVTTGRARRIGWFDGVAAKYSQLVNGFSGLVLTRLDILDDFDSVKVCIGYKVDGKRIEELVGCKVQIISTGPRREETIQLEPIFD